MKHLVIHQDRRRGSGFFHECHMVWTLKGGGSGLVLSRIITGSDPATHYGSENPVIVRRLDRLKARIDRGEHFARGALFTETPRIGKSATCRLQGQHFRVVGELYYAIATEPRYVVMPSTVDSPNSFQSVPGSTSRWSDYLKAHKLKLPGERGAALRQLVSEIVLFCEPVGPAEFSTREYVDLMYPLLSQRRATRGEKERAYFASAKSLAQALGEAILGVSVRTIERRVHLQLDRPGEYGL